MAKFNLRGFFQSDMADAEGHAAEGRQSPRRRLHLETTAKGAVRGHDPVVIHNVSETGLLLETASVFRAGDEIEVDLPGIDGARAQVVWASGQFYGCRFEQEIPIAALRPLHSLAMVPLRQDRPPQPQGRVAVVPSVHRMDFGERLFRLRKAHGLTLDGLAGQLGVSKPTVWAWEKGRARPSQRYVEAMAELLGVPAAELAASHSTSDISELIARCRNQIAVALATEPDRVRISFEL